MARQRVEKARFAVHPRDVQARPPLSWFIVIFAPAALMAVFSLVLLGLPYRQGIPNLPPVETVAVAALACTLPLLLRRSHAELSLILIGLAWSWYIALLPQQSSGPSLALWIALFSVGVHGRTRWRTHVRLGVGLLVVGSVAWHVLDVREALAGELPYVLLASVSYNAFLYVAAWLMGDWLRRLEVYETELDLRARELERSRAARERQVVQDERIRIARELHDVVAHHVSLMGIQAGAARSVLDGEPSRARELLMSIEASSRKAVDEMRRLLSTLRADPNGASADRMPNLAQLDELVASARATGLDATLTIHGQPRADLPETLDLSAYRIVQEAVTNSIRHARARRLDVELTYGPTALDLRVTDDGVGDGSGAASEGRGLVGMRERTALFGGTLAAGASPSGGFVIEAHLPVPGASSTD